MRSATLPPSSRNESRWDPFTRSPDLRSVRPVPPTVPAVFRNGWLSQLSLRSSSNRNPPLLSLMKPWTMFAWQSFVRVCHPAPLVVLRFRFHSGQNCRLSLTRKPLYWMMLLIQLSCMLGLSHMFLQNSTPQRSLNNMFRPQSVHLKNCWPCMLLEVMP
ncbi:hypothetical protein LINGRAHAP2_LOCUS22762 [Linum grandiflorum]